MVSFLQDLFDSFQPAEQRQIIEDAGLGGSVFATSIDVRLSPDAILASILRRRPLTNEEFALAVTQLSIPILNTQDSLDTTIELKFNEDGRVANGLQLNELTATSVVICETAFKVAEVLAEVSNRQFIPEPPVVKELFAGSVGLLVDGAKDLIGAINLIMHAANSLIAHADPKMLAEIGLAGGGTFSIGKFVNWRKTFYEGSKAKADARLKEIELTEKLKREANAPAPAPPASFPIVIQTLNIYVTPSGLSPALATQVVNEALPVAIQSLISAGRPGVEVKIGGQETAKGANTASA
jgi:hypothetical protein